MVEIKNLEGINYLTAGNPESDKTIIIFHGYGASANDLFSLHKFWDPEEQYNWIFANGILDLAMSPHMQSRAWFPIDLQAYEKQMQEGEFRDLASARPNGLDLARDKILGFISKIVSNRKKLIIGGFSQGAMLSLELSFYLKPRVDGLLLLSGGFIDEHGWSAMFEQLSGMSIFQSHGKSDPILSFLEAKRLNEQLGKAGVQSNFVEFEGQHEIPAKVITGAKEYIKNI